MAKIKMSNGLDMSNECMLQGPSGMGVSDGFRETIGLYLCIKIELDLNT